MRRRIEPNVSGFPWPRTLPVYHATIALNEILRGGIKTRAQLAGPVHATGGGTAHAVSFTLDRRVAVAICIGLKTLRRGARGELSMEELIQQAQVVAPLGTATALDNPEWRDRQRLRWLDEGRRVFSYGFSGTWPKLTEKEYAALLELAGDEIEVLEEERWGMVGLAPAEAVARVRGEWDRWKYNPTFYDLYKHLLAYGDAVRQELYDPFFIHTRLDILADLREDDIGIIKATVDAESVCMEYREAIDMYGDEGAGVNAKHPYYDYMDYPLRSWPPSYVNDWSRSCEQHIESVAAGRDWEWRSRPPNKDWTEPKPSETVSYLGHHMAELRVFDTGIIHNIEMSDDLNDVTNRVQDAWDRKGFVVDDPYFHPYFRPRPTFEWVNELDRELKRRGP